MTRSPRVERGRDVHRDASREIERTLDGSSNHTSTVNPDATFSRNSTAYSEVVQSCAHLSPKNTVST
jgi:hypothetical protein